MKKVLLLLAVFFSAVVPAKSNVIYSVNLTLQDIGFPDGTVTGTITTDGATGILSTSDMVDFNLALAISGGGSLNLLGPLSGNSAGVDIQGTSFTATSSALFFQFGGDPITDFALFQKLPLGNGTDFFLMAGNDMAVGIGDDRAFSPQDSALVQIGAAAVPGPVAGAGLPGLLAGFGAMLVWYRRRRLFAI